VNPCSEETGIHTVTVFRQTTKKNLIFAFSQSSIAMKNFLKWGIFITAVNLVFLLIGYAAGTSTTPASRYRGWATTIIGLGMLFWGIREKKNEDPAGFTFGRGWVEGVLISLVAGVLVAILLYIFAEIINPEMMEYSRSEAMKSLQTMPNEQRDQAKKMVELFTSAPMIAVFTLLSYAIGGMIVSLIFAPIVKSMGGNSPQVENA
jgi:cytochrome c biogenesis protein CcdA